jgi:hypothetical protein
LAGGQINGGGHHVVEAASAPFTAWSTDKCPTSPVSATAKPVASPSCLEIREVCHVASFVGWASAVWH